ncbi:MAG: hypothetical protein ABI374_10885 [Ginsengibacter sp.]
MALSMKHKSLKFVGLLLIWIIYSSNGYAQTNDSLNVPGGVQIQELQKANRGDTTTDTSLQKNHIKENPDFLKWKKNREFAYMHYLDSLLRKEKDLKVDTVSIDEKSGTIKRNGQRQSHPSALNTIFNSVPFQIFFWILAVIFIVFISYKVFFTGGFFSGRKKICEETDDVFLPELNEVSEYDALITQAEDENNLNLAARYLFLKTLKSLSDKEFIQFTAEKTNKEYLKEMEQNNYFKEFQELTHSYEYLWYGKFLVEKEYYQKVKEAFELFNKKV